MADIKASKLKEDILEILKKADLSTLSGKKVRKQLEESYGVDLTDRKKEIDEIMMKTLDEIQNKKEESENEPSDVESSASEEVEDMEPVIKKKKIAAKVENGDAGSDVDDETLAKQLQEEENSGRSRRSRGQPVKTKTYKKKVKDPSEKKPPKQCFLSPQLAAIVGSNMMARSDVVKKMWEIIKERELQDPKQRNFMLCDEELYPLFGRKRVKTFGMMKYLSSHIFKSEQDYEDTTC